MTIPKLALAALAILALAPTSAFARHHHRAHASIDANGNDSVTYLPHPAECSYLRTRFCGCGARNALGISDRRYDVAGYWAGHYTGPTLVASWGYHVAIIRELYGDGTALLEDYNSGGHMSRLHRRSIAGAQILGGSAGAYASSEFHARSRHSHAHTRYAVAEPPAAPDVAAGAH